MAQMRRSASPAPPDHERLSHQDADPSPGVGGGARRHRTSGGDRTQRRVAGDAGRGRLANPSCPRGRPVPSARRQPTSHYPSLRHRLARRLPGLRRLRRFLLLLLLPGALIPGACLAPPIPATATAYVATPTPLPPTPTSFLAPLTPTVAGNGSPTPSELAPFTPTPTAPPAAQTPR